MNRPDFNIRTVYLRFHFLYTWNHFIDRNSPITLIKGHFDILHTSRFCMKEVGSSRWRKRKPAVWAGSSS